MSESAASFVGDIPEEYDRGLGPIIFADFAIDMARRVAAARPMRVLETAAGTGIVTRLLRDLLPAAAHLTATDLNAPMLAMNKDPSCGCCGAWVDHIRLAGFPADVVETLGVNRIKTRLGVPPALASCHTAEVDGFVVEGHVPASALKRLLAERPATAKGLAVPGMPVGSPGMEVDGVDPDEYDVVLFDAKGQQRRFARFRGGRELPA